MNKHWGIKKLLIKHGADPLLKNGDCWTAVEVAKLGLQDLVKSGSQTEVEGFHRCLDVLSEAVGNS